MLREVSLIEHLLSRFLLASSERSLIHTILQVKYIWVGINYRELREVLKDGKKLRSFPLVDNPQNMILLGSIQRTELITVSQRDLSKKTGIFNCI